MRLFHFCDRSSCSPLRAKLLSQKQIQTLEKSLMNSFMQLHSATHGRCSIDRKHAFGDLKSLWDLQVVTVIALSCVLRRFGSLQQVVAGSNLKMPETSGIDHQDSGPALQTEACSRPHKSTYSVETDVWTSWNYPRMILLQVHLQQPCYDFCLF